MRPLHALTALVVLVAAQRSVEAAPSAGVEAKVDRAIVGVGDVVTYTLVVKVPKQATSYEHAPGKLPGFDLVSVSTSPGSAIFRVNGVVQYQTTITVNYKLRAKTVGKHELGPGKLTIDEVAHPMPKVGIEVVPAGKAPPPPKKAKDPFDDFFFKMGDDEDEFAPPPPKDDVPDPLARVDELPAGAVPEPMFVRVAVDDLHPVIGQAVTAKLFVYSRLGARFLPSKPLTFPDFANVRLRVADDKWRPITIGGQSFQWKLWEASAIFPLRTGKLEIPAAEVEGTRIDTFTMGGPVLLKSKAFTIEAAEPKLEGRPVGYVLGDVAADLELQADVQPRDVKDGHALVELKLRGMGRIERLTVTPPTVPGVTWTSTTDTSKTTVDATTVRGGRRLLYDARFDQPGDVDLGAVRVPVWDPLRKGYVVAQAQLGKVHVTTAAPAPSASTSTEWILPAPREELGRTPSAPRLADRAWPWIVAGGAPLSVLALSSLLRASRTASARRQVARDKPGNKAREALAKLGDGVDDAARALDLALETRLGRPSRGLTQKELRKALVEAGESEHVAEIVALHEAIATARFAKETAPSKAKVRAVAGGLLDRAPAEETP
ncbi:MAG: BatD family protein [Myxococcales bacterium]|nr:BatD family protein [Myxococcales bacterium]